MQDPGNTHERFRTTCWTEIRGLSAGSDAERRRAVEALLARYWPPVYAELRGRGCSPDEAADLTQEFFTGVVLGRGIFVHADRARGRLRNLLLIALRNFVVDQHRRRVVRGDDVTIPLDSIREEEARSWVGDRHESRGGTFERRWALAILEEALRRCESHFHRTGKRSHWQLFDEWILIPARAQSKRSDFSDVARAAGFPSPAAASSALQVVKERTKALMREVVGETVEDGADIEAEMADVRAHLEGP